MQLKEHFLDLLPLPMYSLQERAEAKQKSTGSVFATKASLGEVPNMTLTKFDTCPNGGLLSRS
jgi:hypothetical protein